MLARALQAVLGGALAGTLLTPQPVATAAAPAARPDLAVTRVSDPPADALRGQAFRVQDRVRNTGGAAAGKSRVRYWLSLDAKRGKGDLVLGTRTVGRLAPGRKAKGSVQLTVPTRAAYGSYRLIACADATAAVRERREGNNCRVSKRAVRVRATPVTPPSTGPGQPGQPGQPGEPEQPEGLRPTPIDPTVPTDFQDSVEFLYEGPDAVQHDVADGAVDAERVVVLRGVVVDEAGAPLPGARVSVLGEGDLGWTLTREDGGFDLAANGGAPVTLEIAKDGLLPVQRTVAEVPWQDFVVLDHLVLLPLDEQATVVDLGTTEGVVVAEAAPVTDDEGSRQAVLLFEPGTEAEMTLPDGTTQPLERMTVRATEYTVGEDGPARMPGALPATSGYTYAAEFGIDEAVAAGATSVAFSKPVVNYLENYLGMPVGVAVPSGYYDRERGVWVAGRNGRVIAVVGETDGRADVDVTGDGTADTGAALTTLGIDDAERATLAERYDAGQELWRVLLDHFTPWDHNFPYGPPEDAVVPEQPEPTNRRGPRPDDRPCVKTGSVIGCQSQTLGESLPVTGTDHTLEYSSARAGGGADAYVLRDIPVTGSAMGPIRGATLEVTVAGRTFTKQFSGAPHQSHSFVWDGLDAYGRRVQGEQRVDVRVDYHYGLQYYASTTEFASSFGRTRTETGATPTGGISRVDRAAQTMALSSSWRGWLGAWQAPLGDLGGWSLSAHHVYDSATGTLHLGDGSSRRADTLDMITREVGAELGQEVQFSPDLASDAEGRIYAMNPNDCNCVWRLDGPDLDDVTVVAGGQQAGFAGDGGPATEALLHSVGGVAVAPDGTIFLSDSGNHRVRRVGPDGIITTVAGTGTGGFSGDGGPATEAALKTPTRLTVEPDGSVYVVDQGNRRIRRIGTDGLITTVAGGGNQLPSVDGVPATSALIHHPHSVAVGPDGSLYYSDPNGENHTGMGWVRRVTPDGDVATVAGGGAGPDGNEARNARLNTPTDLAVAADGTLYIADSGHYRVRTVEPDGIIRTVAGSGECCSPSAQVGSPARSARLLPRTVLLGPDGRLRIGGQDGIYRVAPASARLADGELTVPSSDGSRLYQFARSGRHLRTVDSVTLAVVHEFGYDAAGRLTSVTDGDGRVTTVERTPAGVPAAIVAPGGQRTTLEVDALGHLSSIANPAGEKVVLVTAEDGLLKSFTDPLGHTSTFGYDDGGRLVSDAHEVLGEQTLERTELDGGYRVVHTSAEGLETTYETTQDAVGRVVTTTTDPAGGRTVVTENADGTTTASYPDGSTMTTTTVGDPRWGMAAPYESRVVSRLPSGLTKTALRERAVELADADDPLTVTTVHDRLVVNGRAETYEHDVEVGEVRVTTAEGVTTVSKVDEQGRVHETLAAEGGTPTIYEYDDLGRLESVAQGDQRTAYGYDARGRTSSVTDGLGHTTTYTFDDADRVATMTLPGLPARTYAYGYDDNGNRTSITMPNGQVHSQTYSPRDQLLGYRPGPGLPGPTSTRDDDGKVLERTLADGSTLTRGYDDGGRARGTAYTEADLHFTYVAQSEVVDVLTRTPAGEDAVAQVLDLDHDATLLTGSTSSGLADGEFAYAHDSDYFLTGIELVSGDDERSLPITRDDDGAITKVGAFTWARTGIGRALGSIGDGTLDADLAHDGTGRFTGRTDTVAGTAAYDLDLTYDDAGRIATRTERVGSAAPVTSTYSYDEAGQLETVRRGSQVVESYAYDVNGNRTTPSATYDEQDRMTSLGGVGLTYDDNGFVTGRGTDDLVYSENGELISATVDGETVTYAYDAVGRLVARTAEEGTTQYLYGNPGQPFQVTASRSAAGVLTSLEYDEDGRLYAMRRAGSTYYVSSDQLGTPRVVTDATGAVVATRAHDSLGVPDPAGTTHPEFDVPIGFAGGIADPLTGLVRFGFRDYDPVAGRWTSRDPALFAGGQANLYQYVGNNPVLLRDPAGLWCIGGSLYGGIGGGAQFCYKDGDASLCAEVGFGLGADAGLEMGEAAQTGTEVGAEAKAVCGPVGAGFGCSLDSCGEAKCKGKVEAGPLTLDTEGNVGVQPKLDGPEVILAVGGRPKCSLQGKAYGKACQRF
jgi:RHS repeat-associated protein